MDATLIVTGVAITILIFWVLIEDQYTPKH